LRLEGVEAIAAIRTATGLPCVGLLKRTYPDSEVFITPTMAEVEALIDLGCEVVAMDATERPRGVALADLVARVHAAGRLAMADCDTPASVDQAVALGFDVIGTTLSGYTPASSGVGDGRLARAWATGQTWNWWRMPPGGGPWCWPRAAINPKPRCGRPCGAGPAAL